MLVFRAFWNSLGWVWLRNSAISTVAWKDSSLKWHKPTVRWGGSWTLLTNSVCCYVSASVGKLTHGPRNIVVVSGSRATFTCVTDLDSKKEPVCWKRSDSIDLLCSGAVDQCNPRYTASQNQHNHSFTIDSCNSTDSGSYACDVCTASGTRRYAHLVVLGMQSQGS